MKSCQAEQQFVCLTCSRRPGAVTGHFWWVLDGELRQMSGSRFKPFQASVANIKSLLVLVWFRMFRTFLTQLSIISSEYQWRSNLSHRLRWPIRCCYWVPFWFCRRATLPARQRDEDSAVVTSYLDVSPKLVSPGVRGTGGTCFCTEVMRIVDTSTPTIPTAELRFPTPFLDRASICLKAPGVISTRCKCIASSLHFQPKEKPHFTLDSLMLADCPLGWSQWSQDDLSRLWNTVLTIYWYYG